MNPKIKYGCETAFASCVTYETPLPDFSEIVGCADLDETTTELYCLVKDIKTEIDLSELGEKCLTYTEVAGKTFVKNALLKMEEEICLLKEEVNTLKTTAIFDKPLTGSGIDLDCLPDFYIDPITTYGDLFQALIAKVCTP
jgi:hypothetical protein